MSEVSVTPTSTESVVNQTAPDTNVSATPTDTSAVSMDTTAVVPPKDEQTSDLGREEVNFSARFVALARKERELQKRDQETKQRLQDPGYVAWLEAQKEKNPIKALQALGFRDFHEAAQWVLNDGKKTPEQEIADIKRQIQEEKDQQQALAEQQKNEYIESVFQDAQRQIDAHIDTSGDAYELTKLNGASSEVLELIKQHFEATKEVLPLEKACQMVEDYFYQEAQKLLKAKKFAPKVDAPKITADDTNPPAADEPKTVPGSKTLTNSTVIAAPQKPQQTFLSDEESKAKAAALLDRLLKEQRA